MPCCCACSLMVEAVALPTTTSSPAPSLSKAITGLLRRDLLLAYRHRGEIINPILFFILVTALVPISVGGDPKDLAKLAPGMIWVMALL